MFQYSTIPIGARPLTCKRILTMPTRLNNPDYMKFPLEIGAHGAETSTRRLHVREQIEQVLFTHPGERWFRPEFGIGVRALVFEPNNLALWEVTKKRLLASLRDALAGANLTPPQDLMQRLTELSEPVKSKLGANADYFQSSENSRTH